MIFIITGVIILAAAFTYINSNPAEATERMTKSSQYKDGKFKNADKNPEWAFGSSVSIMWDFLTTSNNRKPKVDLPKQNVDMSFFNKREDAHLNVTWLGHSSLLINIDGYKILADPVFEKSVSLFGPTRYNGEVPLNIDDIPDVDLIIISHDHYDHLNQFSIEKLHVKTKQFIVPLGLKNIITGWGVPENKIIELDWWEEYRYNDELLIASTPAQHFSGRGLTNRNGTLWTSYVIKSEKHNLYFGGDSGYFDGFKLIGEKYGPFDMTFLECGAYNEKWSEIHMMPEETVQAHLDLGGKVLHPIHWGTFDLALHPWYDPMTRVAKAADSLGVKLATPIIGGTTVYETEITSKRWWEKVQSIDYKIKGE